MKRLLLSLFLVLFLVLPVNATERRNTDYVRQIATKVAKGEITAAQARVQIEAAELINKIVIAFRLGEDYHTINSLLVQLENLRNK